ncbi:tRNA lysidine(34) synthetase TilS [bacterium]|jgi:tRNA(Ile)-lysidine synthase|nr:tRNA lysidine(34) synthetase TilS [bacterium]
MHDHPINVKIAEFIREKRLFSKQDKVLLACSGGPDSMLLAHFLHQYLNAGNLRLVYFNHGLRESARNDEDVVMSFAETKGVRADIIPIDVEEEALTKKLSIELAGRKLRLKELSRLKHELDVDYIAMGHHLDDFCETFFQKLLRGAKYQLGGILPKISLSDYQLTIVRPLLCLEKSQILDYMPEKGYAFSQDESNFDQDIQRNYIRHALLPSIEEMDPHYKTSLLRLGDYLEDWREYVGAVLVEPLSLVEQDESSLRFPKTDLKAMHPFLQKQFIYTLVRMFMGTQYDVSEIHIKEVFRAISGSGFKEIQLPGNCIVSIDQHTLSLRKAPTEHEPFSFEVGNIQGELAIELAGVTIQFSLLDTDTISYSDIRKGSPNAICIDADQVDLSSLSVRNRIEGDSFVPLGMSKHKSVKAYMIDEKVPKGERDNTPLFFSGEELIWIGGYQISDVVKVTDHTKRLLRIALK